MKCSAKIMICIGCFAFLLACKKDKDFPNEPVLKVREFSRIDRNYAVWRIGFTDGDGDLGVRQNQNDSTNFIFTIFRVDSAKITEEAGSNYRVPVVENIRTAAGIEGEIRFDIDNLDIFRIDPTLDTIYYSGYIIDRAGNRSNTVETPQFSIK